MVWMGEFASCGQGVTGLLRKAETTSVQPRLGPRAERICEVVWVELGIREGALRGGGQKRTREKREKRERRRKAEGWLG
jgi:hypothetical protein